MSANTKIDDIMEDLMVGHNFEYAGKALKELVSEETEQAVRDALSEERFSGMSDDGLQRIINNASYEQRRRAEEARKKNGRK